MRSEKVTREQLRIQIHKHYKETIEGLHERIRFLELKVCEQERTMQDMAVEIRRLRKENKELLGDGTPGSEAVRQLIRMTNYIDKVYLTNDGSVLCGNEECGDS